MALSSHSLLAQLELVMTEFFTGNASNERKREIELHLNTIWLQPDAWEHCLYCITNTHNDYVSMACISALENLINHQFSVRLTVEELTKIRHTVLLLLKERHLGMPNFTRNKLVKVVVDIARYQWPHDYPSFIDDVLHIGENVQGGIVLCLTMLQLITEELAIKEYQLMPHTRKQELKSLLNMHAPRMLQYVTGVLQRILVLNPNPAAGNTTTPPPSPSASPPPSPPPAANINAGNSELQEILKLLEQRSQHHYQQLPPWLVHALHNPPVLDTVADTHAYVALNTLSQLIVWIPLELLTHNNNKIIDIIFTYITLCGNGNVHSIGSSNSVSISAVSCIQELLTRPCIPPSVNSLLLHVVHCCCVFVNQLLTGNKSAEGNNQAQPQNIPVLFTVKQRLSLLHSTYLEKITEVLRILVNVYFRRFEHHPHFNVEEFLSLLFRFSFSQPSLDGYLECLEIWSTLLDHMWGRGGHGADGALPYNTQKYKNVLELLVKAILYKIQLKHNQNELDELDFDMLVECGPDDHNIYGEGSLIESWDDSGNGTEHLTEQSECQSFFNQNLELLARLAEVLPEKLTSLLIPEWHANCSVYFNLVDTLQLRQVQDDSGLTVLRMGISSLSDDMFIAMHCALRDLCTQLQLLGRLAVTFLGTQLVTRADTALHIIGKIVELGEYGARLQLYSLDTTVETLKADVIQIHCEVLCCLRAWSHWLSQLYGHEFTVTKCSAGDSSSSNAQQAQATNGSSGGSITTSNPHLNTCHTLYRQLLALSASADKSTAAPWVVVKCGVQLLLTLSLLVVSPVALEVPQVQRLYSTPVYSSDGMPSGKVKERLYRALVNLLLLPWPPHSLEYQAAHTQQDRQRMLATFMHGITQPLTMIDASLLQVDNTARDKGSGSVKECLRLLKSQLCQLTGADRVSRELYWTCVREPINKTVMEHMPVYSNNPDVLLEIVGTVMWCVGVVGGGSGTTNASVAQVCDWIERLVQLLTQPSYISIAATHDHSPQSAVITRFLQLLSLVLSDPSPGFKKLVGAVVGTLDLIYPQVSQQPSGCSLRQPIFAVLRTLLEHNWKYFYRPSIQQPLSQSAWEEVQNGEQLNRILQAYGQSFMQTDITVFRQNLATLQLLNNKFRLYSKNIFRPLLSQFLTVLLQVLLHGSHALLQDEIISCVYHMACVDINAFHSQFLVEFLRNTDGLTEEQREALRSNFSTDSDLPTFSQNVQRLTNDMRYFRSF